MCMQLAQHWWEIAIVIICAWCGIVSWVRLIALSTDDIVYFLVWCNNIIILYGCVIIYKATLVVHLIIYK